MELALRLGDASKSLPSLLIKAPLDLTPPSPTNSPSLDICMALGVGRSLPTEVVWESGDPAKESSGDGGGGLSDSSCLLQLDLLPLSPVPRSCKGGGDRTAKCSSHFRLPWLVENLGCKPESSSLRGKHLDVNLFPVAIEDMDDVTAQSSSLNSAASSFPMDFGIAISGRGRRSETEGDTERDCLRGSDEDENGSMRKKLRLSKEQSAFLEENFKEHSTLNPKQKLALAKQLSLTPRQVEVWFQNRRARTKLKQTEIDFEYLKRYYETLKEENRRLQKELQDLKALKTARPFYLHPPATTLTMCPSCERSSIPATSPATATAMTVPKRRMHPFGGSQPGQGQQQQQQYSTGPIGS